jgi:hypothetical protein
MDAPCQLYTSQYLDEVREIAARLDHGEIEW